VISPNLIYPILIASFVGYFLRTYVSDSIRITRCPSFWGMIASLGLLLWYVIYNVTAPDRTVMSWLVFGAAVLIAGGAVAVNWRRSHRRSFSIDL
jgi:vacuolar-type H+-ATPase subunit I/STV1